MLRSSAFREASGDDSWMAELSNMLHHLYRLRKLCKTRLVDFEQLIEPQAPTLKLERGATWARNCDTHWLFRLPSAGLAPVYAETYGAVYGELLWRRGSSCRSPLTVTAVISTTRVSLRAR